MQNTQIQNYTKYTKTKNTQIPKKSLNTSCNNRRTAASDVREERAMNKMTKRMRRRRRVFDVGDGDGDDAINYFNHR